MNAVLETEQNPVWHTMNASTAAKIMNVDPLSGLSREDVENRRAVYGTNRLSEQAPRSKLLIFLDQFKSMLILVLIGAAILAGIIGDVKDAVVILIVVVFNALLGFWQEYRAERTLAALKKMLSPVAKVRRGGRMEEVLSEALVPGDIVLLEAGDRVPADGRLILTRNVEINESALTGESHPVLKEADRTVPETSPLADRISMAYMNSVVTRGRAEVVVTATGMTTEMGRLSGMIAAVKEGPTPLQIQLDLLGRRLTVIAVSVIGLILIIGLVRNQPLVQIIFMSIALAVAAIPEGLPAVVTVTLAIGMHRMAKHRAIVKRLSAVETLGCTTVICSDKTGTLTVNEMTVRAVVFSGRRFSVTGSGYGTKGEIISDDGRPLPQFSPLFHPAVLANDSSIGDGKLIGDPTEGALLAFAAKAGGSIETLRGEIPRIAEVPFDSKHKFQATFHKEGDAVRVFVKGAPDVLLTRSVAALSHKFEVEPLAEESRTYWVAENDRLGEGAMRVIAMATKRIKAAEFDEKSDLMQYIQGLTFVGLVGIIDPPRPEARDAIALCKSAGIQVKMITGDHRITAAAIARELGLVGEVLEGKDLDRMPPEELAKLIDRIVVFARVAPEHKVRIVQALKANGHVTAMTGDGVNDAPALKNADIGVAMGITGTEVTKEAATMVLTDDNFATIVQAVKEGRAIYDNIVKFVRFQLSTNMGAIVTMLWASLLGWHSPFTAIQILWINIIMDGPPAMSLGVESPRDRIMDDPPRNIGERVLTAKRLVRLFFYGLIMAAGTLGIFQYRSVEGLDYGLSLAFTTFVLFQFFNLFNARNEHGSVLSRQFFSNRWLWLSLIAVVLLQVLVVNWSPAQSIFQTTDLRLGDWLLATLVASSILILDELLKFFNRLGHRKDVRGSFSGNRI